MKKGVLLGVLVLMVVAATAFLLIRHRIPSSTTRQIAAKAKQEASRSSPDPDVPDADWRDEKLWEQTPEYAAVTKELEQIARYGGALENLTPDQVEVLIEYMHSPHYEARIQAVLAAKGWEYTAAVKSKLLPHVIGLLSDPVPEVRFWTTVTLRSIGDKDTIPFLYPLLHDESLLVRIGAQRAISKLQAEETAPGK
jgi:hypothetical protein